MDTLITAESIGRRPHINGDEMDYLTTRRGTSYPVANHGLRGVLKTIARRRDRRTTREVLRNYEGE